MHLEHLVFLLNLQHLELSDNALHELPRTFAKLRRLRMNPSGRCDDAPFIRRTSLDIIGRLPTAEEARSFVANPAPDKRSKLVDKLLQRPEYAEFWALKWSDLLRNEEKVLDRTGVEKFHAWMRDSIGQFATMAVRSSVTLQPTLTLTETARSAARPFTKPTAAYRITNGTNG